MRLPVVAVCAVVLAGVYYFYQQQANEQYRRDAIAKIEVAAVEIATAQLNIARIDPYDDNGNLRDLSVVREERKIAQDKLDELVANYFKLEREIKEYNNGELPGWVKDNRSWQSLDAKIKR